MPMLQFERISHLDMQENAHPKKGYAEGLELLGPLIYLFRNLSVFLFTTHFSALVLFCYSFLFLYTLCFVIKIETYEYM